MSSQERCARVRALGKINLELRVLNRRTDGYHELRTVFQTISLADRLEIAFRPARQSSLTVESEAEITGNLVERAARCLLEATPMRGRVCIRLSKLIPVGAGLGGGSSDAAAVLLALPVLAGVRLPLERLIELGAELGSDVPFFLLGGRAVGLGRGSELYPLPEQRGGWAAVVAPAVSVSTAEAYAALGRGLTAGPQANIINSFQSRIWSQAIYAPRCPDSEASNDFEPVVFRQQPSLARLKRRLLGEGARAALMSGSGSAVFGLFATRQEAESIRRGFAEKVFVVSLVSRARYRRLWQTWLRPHVTGPHWPPQSRYAR